LKGLCHGASPVGSRLAAAISYRAAWSLPGPDFHRLVSVISHEATYSFRHLPSRVPRYLGTPKPGQLQMRDDRALSQLPEAFQKGRKKETAVAVA